MITQFLPQNVLLSFFISCLCSMTSAQTSQDTLQAHQYFVKGDSLRKQREYVKSIDAFKSSADLFKKHFVWNRYFQSYNKIAQNQYRLKKFEEVLRTSKKVIDFGKIQGKEESLEQAKAYINIGRVRRKRNKNNQAIEAFKNALNILQKRVDTTDLRLASLYNHIAISYTRLGLVEDAQSYYSFALDINQHLYNQKQENDLGTIYFNQAILYSRNGLYRQATPFYEKTIQLDIEQYGEIHRYVAEDYNNLAANYSYIGEDYLALQYFQKQLNILKKIVKDENDESLASAFRGIATQYTRLDKLDQALENYNKALRIYQSIYDDNNISIANILLNIGGTYRLKNQPDESLKYLNRGTEIYKNIVEENHPDMLFPNDELGLLYEKQNEYELASAYYQKNIDIAVNNFGLKNQKTAEAYISKARIYLLKKDYAAALQEFHKATIAASKEFKDTSPDSSPSIDDYINSSVLLSAIHGKAKTLKLRAQSDKEDSDLITAHRYFFTCDSLIDITRNTYTSIKDKALLEKVTSEVYKNAISTSWLLYNKTNNKKYLKHAFYFSEKSKARLLDEQLRKIDAKNFSGISRDQLILINDVTDKLQVYTSKLLEFTSKKKTEENESKLRTYNDLVFSYTQKKDSLLNIIEQNYDNYYQLRYDNTIISIDEIQQQIDEHTLLLEYFVDQSEIYVFMISKEKFLVKKVKKPHLDENILQFRQAILDKELDLFPKIGYQLYTTLLRPFLEETNKKENIIVIPDGILWYLNFDLLPSKDVKETIPANLPYLLKKHVVSYSNSAELFFRKNNTGNNNVVECLAFSFSNTENSNAVDDGIPLNTLRNTTADLPGTREEIRAISDIIDGVYFYGTNAKESNFKDKANDFALIHLAVHGEIDDKEPGNSRLFFTQTKDSIQDNYLYNEEIYNMEIPAELVVLSACNTGTGKISKGEGIMSLGRAFQYAGTKSLILTNWEVSDETTPQIMKNFYTNLKKGMSKPKALQQAKLQYLNATDVYHTDPFYWGGFYLMGDVSTVAFESDNNYFVFIGIGLLLGLLLFFLLKKAGFSLHKKHSKSRA